MGKDKLSFQLGITIHKNKHFFGPGAAKIMELVKQTGSLSKAYNIMGLSSSKGWRMIKKAEENLGFPLIISTVGGEGGRGSKLSEKGEEFLKNYTKFNQEANKEVRVIFNKYFEEYNIY